MPRPEDATFLALEQRARDMHQGRVKMSITGYPPTDAAFNSAVAVRRFANETIKDTAQRFGDDSATVYEFLCECGDLRCRELVKLTLAEYDESDAGFVRAH